MQENRFLEELTLLNIKYDDEKLSQLNKYYEMLVEWNEKINLTAITEKEQVYLKHFYDSLTFLKAIDLNEIESLCDVGTGAGFPGLVLKIFYPHLKLTLIDSLNKRTIFLNEVVKELGLKDVEIIHTRCEEYALKNREVYDVVTARAVANLSMLMEYCSPLVKKDGYFIPMKAVVEEEINATKKASNELSLKLLEVIEFNLPIEESKRTIIKYRKENICNKKYPRKFSEMKKKPL